MDNGKKILFLNTYQKKGGAARATWNMFNALKHSNINVKHLSLFGEEKGNNYTYIFKLNGLAYFLSLLIRGMIEFFLRIKFRDKSSIKFSINYTILPGIEHKWIEEADVLFFNWTNDGFFKVEQIIKYSKIKDVIWFLHDMWPFTGGCHYSMDCKKYSNKCDICPNLGSKKSSETLKQIRVKKELKEITFIGASDWIISMFSISNLSKQNTISYIPLFYDRKNLRTNNKIKYTSNYKKVISFGAVGGPKNQIKGFDYFISALKKIISENDLSLKILIFGSDQSINIDINGCEIINMGKVKAFEKIVEIYSMSDVYVNSSLAESFGQTTLESLFCNTPVVAFKNTGADSIIEHKKNGFLAEYKNINSLADGILFCLSLEFEDGYFEKFSKKVFIRNFEKKVLSKIT